MADTTFINVYAQHSAMKKKLTLSISEDLLREVKLIARQEGKSLSSIVEEYFEQLIASKWAEELAKDLGALEPTSEMPRPDGLDAAEIVRDLRKGRERRILHA